MFASIWLLAAAGQLNPVVIPLGHPKQIEQPRAPLATYGPLWASTCGDSTDYNQAAPPVRIFGDTYLVGTCGISSILITDPAGDILIDGGTEQDADLIAANIRRLGFQPTDVRYILESHEHYDHVGGVAKLQRITGAQVLASAAAAPVLNSGQASKDDPQYGINPGFPAAHVDRIVQDGELVRLGNIIVTAVATPGHTPGAMTWRWGSCDGGVCRQIVYADSLTPVSSDSYRFTDHPAYLAAFHASIAKVAALPCDILLTPHPTASDMPRRLLNADVENPNACKDYAAKLTEQLDERLAKEAGK